MKVALLCEYSRDMGAYQGSNIYITELITRLAGRDDIDLHLITMGRENAVRQEEGFTHHILRKGGPLSLPYLHPLVLLRMVKTVRAIRPDIVHALSTRYPCSTVAVLLQNDYPSLVTAFGIFEREIAHYREDMLPLERTLSHIFHTFFIRNERWVLSRAPELVVDAPSIGDLVRTPTTGRIHVVAAGLDLERLRPQILSPPAGEGPDIVFINMLTRLKGADILLSALPGVVEAYPGIRACIGGKGPQAPELRRLARDLGLEANVDFPGFVPDEEKYRYYRQCRMVVVPSRWDCQPSPLFEAAAFGKPVVASDMAHPGIVEDGVTGLIFRSDDAAGLEEKILFLLDDDAARERMGRAAAARVGEYDWPRVVDRYVTIYQDAVREHRRGGKRATAPAGASPER